ncbi:MAG: phosphatidylserine decarboxylase [Bacillota bacterium]|nr:phosphatidylserine decarboxylase [Bacillota bacterium]
MIQNIYRLLIELTNGKWTSALLRRFSRSTLSTFIIPSFAKVYRINQDEMAKTIDQYPTLHDLFIRKLKPGARISDQSLDAVVSPVDAVIENIGTISETSEMTVKGKIYSVEEMLGDTDSLKKYLNGTFMIFYLSPTHYHRIHSPVNGFVQKQWTLGRKSYPVNKLGLKYGIRTLAKNYRMITEVKTDFGHVSIVKVGAMFVNSIEATHEGMELKKGKEMAYFSFGSTVVLLFEKGIFELDSLIQTPHEIKVGEKIGVFKKIAK